MIKKRYTAFLVDDSEDDRLFMQLILKRSSKLVVIGEARDGQEAIDYLKGEGVFSNRQIYPMPDVLLLDLKMPGKNGYDVLQWLKTQSFNDLTVVVVSGSWLAEDISKSLALGAHGYFKKTSVKEEQEVMVHGIENILKEHRLES